MPSAYAHIRFGQKAAAALPPELRISVQRFQQLYEVGLHGPDVFLYYQPLFHTKTGELAGAYHAMTGREFFETAVLHLREEPSEGAEVYLLGVLAHFALDSVCHPRIRSAEGKPDCTEIETEFDRYLLTLDGRVPAHRQYLGGHLRLTRGGSRTAASFYPQVTPMGFRRSLRRMALFSRLLTLQNRDLLQKLVRLMGKDSTRLVMYTRPNHRCAALNPELEALFDSALERYPTMADRLRAHIRTGASLGEDFDVPFG